MTSKAERFAMFCDELDEDATPQPVSATPQPVDVPLPIVADTGEVEDEPSNDDAIEAMQQLLLAHEEQDLHRVEDPELERVLKEIRNLAHSNIMDVFQSDVVREYIGTETIDGVEQEVWRSVSRLTVKDISSLPRNVTSCIQSIEVKSTPQGDVVKVKMYDKLVSLEKLMRFYGAYQRDNEQVAKGTEGAMDFLIASIGSKGMPVIKDNSA